MKMVISIVRMCSTFFFARKLIFCDRYGLVIDCYGNLAVVDRGNRRIQIFGPEGTFPSSLLPLRSRNLPSLKNLTLTFFLANLRSQFFNFESLVTQEEESFFLFPDFYTFGLLLTIFFFFVTGELKFKFDIDGDPYFIAIDNDGNYLVSDGHNNTIQVFSQTGTFFPHPFSFFPESIETLSTTRVRRDNKTKSHVKMFQRTRNFCPLAPSKKNWPGSKTPVERGETRPWDLVNFFFLSLFSWERAPLCCTHGSNDFKDGERSDDHEVQQPSPSFSLSPCSQIHFFLLTGLFLGTWIRNIGSYGKGIGQLDSPTGIDVDRRNGNIIVCERQNHRVQILSPKGESIRIFGSRGKSKLNSTQPSFAAPSSVDPGLVTTLSFPGCSPSALLYRFY